MVKQPTPGRVQWNTLQSEATGKSKKAHRPKKVKGHVGLIMIALLLGGVVATAFVVLSAADNL